MYLHFCFYFPAWNSAGIHSSHAFDDLLTSDLLWPMTHFRCLVNELEAYCVCKQWLRVVDSSMCVCVWGGGG
jgi:hypothetical protein